MIYLKACPKCRGDVELVIEKDGRRLRCMQCSFSVESPAAARRVQAMIKHPYLRPRRSGRWRAGEVRPVGNGCGVCGRAPEDPIHDVDAGAPDRKVATERRETR